MKNIKYLLAQPLLRCLIIGLAAFGLASFSVKASPYASCLTNYNNGGTPQTSDVGFYLNEGGGTVTIIYDDGTTNANFNGITTGLSVPAGSNSFNLQNHDGFQIQVYKAGAGQAKFTSDAFSNNIWANPRGIAIVSNAKKGDEFGRIFMASCGPGGYAFGSAGFKGRGFYALNADFTTALGQGTNAYFSGTFSDLVNVPNGPRLRMCPPGSGLENQVVATDVNISPYTTTAAGNAAIYLLKADLSGLQPLLAGVGYAAGQLNKTHAGLPFCAAIRGSLADGTLSIFLQEADWACLPGLASYGPNTGSGMYNICLRYDVGYGPIPSSGVVGPPKWAYTTGLEGIANLQNYPLDIDPTTGYVVMGFGRANQSNPDMQIVDDLNGGSPSAASAFKYLGGVPQPYFTQDYATISGQDPWTGFSVSAGNPGIYDIKVSPDGQFICGMDINSGLTVASMKPGQGIPDEGTIFVVANPVLAGNGRGVAWDAADNLYVSSSGQGLVRGYTLGITKLCVTSNDWTMNAGTFNFVVPPYVATITNIQPFASQNYINNNSPTNGTPVPGVVRIGLNTNFLSAPLTVSLGRGGTAAYNTLADPGTKAMYTISTNSAPYTTARYSPTNPAPVSAPTYATYGVQILTNSVTFPTGYFDTDHGGPAGSNYFVDVYYTPTYFPASTNTTTIVLGLSNPSGYVAGFPNLATVYIQNTGPQLLVISAAAPGAGAWGNTMYRGYTNDYARFVVTRFGDTNGPGNTPSSVSQNAYTVTNVTYTGTAVYPTDYRARAQRADPNGDGLISTPVDGPTAIVIYPGDQSVTCLVGNPVTHTDLNKAPVDLTLTMALPAGVSQENYPYTVAGAAVSVTIIDNAVGPEVTLWSDTMTNSYASTNYTVTFAGTNFGVGGMPVVYPAYTNYEGSQYDVGGSTNDFEVVFGSDISTNTYRVGGGGPNPVYVPPSPVMLLSNWPQKALKMTVNKAQDIICGVNAYPTTNIFGGNYALRFNMYLSLWEQYIGDPYIVGNYREYATFGINHYGTNCIWRPSTTMIDGTGMMPTNLDGVWFAIDAGGGGITPADYESYSPGPLPNNGNIGYSGSIGLPGKYSYGGSPAGGLPQGVFKHPPFVTMLRSDTVPPLKATVNNTGGGAPADGWADISVEIVGQTNVHVTFNRSSWLANTPITNGSGFGYSYTNGTIMLGYDDPDRNTSDGSAFVYYSNVRVIELSPYIALQPEAVGRGQVAGSTMIVTQGSTVILTSAVAYASAPITSIWYKASAATPGIQGLTSSTLANPYVSSNWFNGTSYEASLLLTNVANGAVSGNLAALLQATNYMFNVRDPAGTNLSSPFQVDVVLTPTNQVATVGSLVKLSVRVPGPNTPLSYQWKTNSTDTAYNNLANSTHYAGVTTTDLFITNAQPADAKLYSFATSISNVVSANASVGIVTQFVSLTMVNPATPAATNALWGQTVSFSVPTAGPTPTYQWRRNGVSVAGENGSAIVLAGINTTNVGTYTCEVVAPNGGNTNVPGQGVLTVSVPPPVFPNGTNLVGIPPVRLDGLGNVVLSFNSPNNPYDTTNSWVLLQTTNIYPTYWTTNTSGVWTTNGDNPPVFMVTVPDTLSGTSNSLFYELRHVQP